MDVSKILAELRAERQQIEAAIGSTEWNQAQFRWALVLYTLSDRAAGLTPDRKLQADAVTGCGIALDDLGCLGRLEEAVSAYDEAIAIRRALVDAEGRVELRNDLALAIMNRAILLQSLGRLEEAVSAYDEAIAIYRSLVDTEGRVELRNDLARALYNVAVSREHMGLLSAALEPPLGSPANSGTPASPTA